ncbi:MAG TPA: DUF4382 domain-containing protein [Geobacterales bacterium]|nr:DUF4382 domain-containing protein [Geobacterales bacterium]
MNKVVVSATSGFLIALLMIAVFEFFLIPSQNIASVSNFNFVLSITDPPITIEGVNAIYLQYGNVLLHKVGGDNWLSINNSGSVELIGLVNSAQILAANNIENGDYDMIRFTNITATVAYYGQNYTALTPSNELLVDINPVLSVRNGVVSTLLIDMIPRVVLSEGNNTSFLLIPFAKAFVANDPSNFLVNVNKNKIPDIMKSGLKIQIKYEAIQNISSLRGDLVISNASINPQRISITLTNNGSSQIELKLLLIYSNVVNPSSKGVIVGAFMFEPNGTLGRMSSIGVDELKQIYHEGNGYILEAGKSKTFVYQGNLIFSLYFKDNMNRLKKEGIKGLNPNMSFIIVIIGEPLIFSSTNIFS